MLWYIRGMVGSVFRNLIIAIAVIALGVAPLNAQSTRLPEGGDLNSRIVFLLSHLADQARQSDDLAFAVRAQAQAATLLWPYDRAAARAIFGRAFDSLSPPAPVERGAGDEEGASVSRKDSGNDLTADERQQLRTDLLNQIADCDAELAEDLARALAFNTVNENNAPPAAHDSEGRASSDAGASFVTVSTRGGADQREALIGVALQVVEREPHRAMTLGQLSLSFGISPNFTRLLLLMRAVDHGLADLLFSSAVARLQRASQIDLSDIHTLGSYLISTAGTNATGSIDKSLITRFLSLAFNQLMQRDRPGSNSDQSAAAYFVGRQLLELFALYLPNRLSELQRRIAEMSQESATDRVVDLSMIEPRAPTPNDIVREARLNPDTEERNSLYARAALAWLAKGEVGEAQSSASQISDAEMRDRVLAQIARRQTSEGHIDDAVSVAQRIEDDTARVGALVRLAGAALASSDRVRAAELLNDAEGEALRARPSIARAQALLTVVSSFAKFDPLRAFEVMQSAVKSINDLLAPEKLPTVSGLAIIASLSTNVRPLKPDELNNLDFESTLAVLARVDFDRALLLAQQLAGNDASVIAQLAVCHGGLTGRPSREVSIDEEGASHF